MSYFLYMLPEESGKTYNSTKETVRYKILLKKLEGTIPQWFEKVLELEEKDVESFINKSLGMDFERPEEEHYTDIPSNLNSIYDGIDEYRNKKFQSDKELFEFLKEVMCPEMGIQIKENSFVVMDTMEFDHCWGFFNFPAVANNELGKILQKLVKIENENEVIKTCEFFTYSAYLDDAKEINENDLEESKNQQDNEEKPDDEE